MPVSAYVANSSSNNVSVIDTVSLTVTATVSVGRSPRGVCVTPDLSTVFVSNSTDGTVSVINALTNVVTHTITVGTAPGGIAVTPDGTKVLVANFSSGNISVISVATFAVIGTVTLSTHGGTASTPWAICISPNSLTAYVSTQISSTAQGWVETINIAALTNSASVMAANQSGTTLDNIQGICVSPDGLHVYVTGRLSGTNSVVSTVSNTVVGSMTDALGQPRSIVILPNGTTGFWTDSVGNLFVFNPATFAVTTHVTLASGDVLSGLAPTSDSTLVFVADDGAGTSAIVWKVNAVTPTTHTSLTTAQSAAIGVGISYYPVPPPPTPSYPGSQFIPRLFIPIKGKLNEDYTQDELMADWLAIEIWSQRWVPPSPIALFLPHKNSTTASDLDANWVGLENWVNQIIQIEKAPYTPLFVPRKSSTKPGDLDIDFLAIQNWANELP